MRQMRLIRHMTWALAAMLLTGTMAVCAETVQERKAGAVAFDTNWTYAGNSVIHTGSAELYTASEDSAPRKNHTVCVNAGHGTRGGESAQTLSHPDGDVLFLCRHRSGKAEQCAVSLQEANACAA